MRIAQFFLALCQLVASFYRSQSSSSIIQSSSLVKTVNASNIHVALSSQPVLLVFGAPWCPHCHNFEGPLQRIAAVLSGEKFTVGKVDVGVEKALASRFAIAGIPAVFLYRDNKMWSYLGPLAAEPIIDFAVRLYAKEKPIDFFNSPVGPLGIAKGIIIRIGTNLMHMMPQITDSIGLPRWTGFIVLVVAITICTLAVTFVGVYLTLHHKTD
jgi:thiol-disulfide isomerase/thioredoxin